ncbi:hypothetical protein [Halobacterium salinarum]|nr:hypothetical protein [Halobacterium salinarum]MDL0144116.1 hypothetical protein [Halobacterium salinarum]
MKILDDDVACVADDDGEKIVLVHEELGTIAEVEGDIEEIKDG